MNKELKELEEQMEPITTEEQLSESNQDVEENNGVEVPERDDYEEEIMQIIRGDESPEVKKERLDDYHENDIAAVLEDLDRQERRKLYSVLGLDRVSEVFAYLDDPEEFIEELDEELAADILENMEPDDAVDILEELEDEKSEALIQLMEEEAREDIDLIQSYGDNEIGSKMTTNFVTLE